MAGFIEGTDRQQVLLPACLDDYVGKESPVRAIEAFVDMLDLAVLGFNEVPEPTGRPGYHPGLILRIYLYGYLNQVQSSRRLERECGRNLELIWLTGQLKPDFETITDFRKDNGPAIRKVCQQFGALCPDISLLDSSVAAIDGSRFKAMRSYWFGACADCLIRGKCTTGKERRIRRWQHEDVLDHVQKRLDDDPSKLAVRSMTVEHPFGTIRSWMGATRFKMRTLKNVATETALHVLSYNMTRGRAR